MPEALFSDYSDFLNRLIDRTVAEVQRVYGIRTSLEKLNGSLAGCAACRDKTPAELKILLSTSRLSSLDARKHDSTKFWWYRSYEEQVGWICNVMSCWLMNRNEATITTHTTVRGFIAVETLQTEALRGKASFTPPGDPAESR